MSTGHAVVMFTDVVGSTELSQKFAPDDAHDVHREHFAILRQALSETGGEEVKHLGDGLMATFASASAAIACAVAMQQGTERDNRGREHQIGLRVGLSGGDIVPDGDDYFGDPVVEAARLCARCEGGQILAAEVVRLMAGRRNQQPSRSLGPVELKGFANPVETVEVLWEPLASGVDEWQIPLPSSLAVHRSTAVVGRDEEMAAIAQALSRVTKRGTLEALFVSGEAGLGKTTLVAAAAQHAHTLGAQVLFGHCEEDLARPYQLWAESLGHYVTHVDESDLLAHVAVHGSELLPVAPTLATRVPSLPPSKATDVDTQRYLLFSAVAGLLSLAAARAPVVLVFDDLQWADAASLALLRHVISAEFASSVLVIATFRPDELPQANELRHTLGTLRRIDSVGRIDLSPLDQAGVATLMESAAGHELDADGVELAGVIHRETDGNPFFVTALLRHLADTGAIRQDASGHWVATASPDALTLPESVREVIGGRIARLGDNAERVLSVAAVIGRDFDLAVLASATATEEEQLLDILDDAAAASLVREVEARPGEFFFSHALIQRTIYNELGATRRARGHREVGEALERVCGDEPGGRVGQLARHWVLAQPPDTRRAVEYSRQAGESALRALAPADALRYFAQALELGEADAQINAATILDLRIGLGIAQRQLGDAAYRETLLEAAGAARAIDYIDHLVAAALANNRGFYSAVGATDTERVEVLETLADSLPVEHESRPLVLAALCSELAHGSPLERRQALAEEAVALAEKCGDEETTIRVLNHLYIPLQVPHLLDVALARTSEAFALATTLGDPALLYWAAMWRAETAARSCDIDTMDRCLAIHRATAEQLNQPIFTWGYLFVRGLRAMIAGDPDEAESLATQAVGIGSESGQPDAGTIFGSQLLIVNGQRGTMSSLIPLIEQMATETPDISPWLFGSLLAKAHAERDDYDHATRLLDDFAAADCALPLDQVWLTGMVDYAEAAIESQSVEHAARLYDQLLPWTDQLPATGASALPPVNQYLGGLATVLGNFEDADAHFVRAASLSRRMDATYFCARNDLMWGRMYCARDADGDRERARALLENAKREAALRGYGSVERKATVALDGLGISR
jgi:class 3 adenylate cyclase